MNILANAKIYTFIIFCKSFNHIILIFNIYFKINILEHIFFIIFEFIDKHRAFYTIELTL